MWCLVSLGRDLERRVNERVLRKRRAYLAIVVVW